MSFMAPSALSPSLSVETDSDALAQVLIRIARTADKLASSQGKVPRSFEEELELWRRAERLVLEQVA
jgi:hypothetical protein